MFKYTLYCSALYIQLLIVWAINLYDNVLYGRAASLFIKGLRDTAKIVYAVFPPTLVFKIAKISIEVVDKYFMNHRNYPVTKSYIVDFGDSMPNWKTLNETKSSQKFLMKNLKEKIYMVFQKISKNLKFYQNIFPNL